MSDRNTIPDFTADPTSMEPALRAIKDIIEQLTGQRASRENTGLRGAPLIYVQGYEPRPGRDGLLRIGTIWINADTDEAFYWSGTMWKPFLGDVLSIVSEQGEVVAELAAESEQEAGEMAFFARNSAPTGWLKANGAAISRTTYARLFDRIGTTFGVGDGSTTFNVPEMRGEFPRGWDDGRSIDTGRVFGSAQGSSVVNHQHIMGHVQSWGPHGTTNVFNETGYFNRTADSTTRTSALTSGAHAAGNNGAFIGSSETRSRNIALLACIKY